MSGLGEKIKEVLTGHHHDDSTSKTAAHDSTHSHPHDHNKLTKDVPDSVAGTHNAKATSNRDSAIGGFDPRSPTTTTHHEAGHQHDPETEAKQATSAAGNYPYWGDLPREQERETNPDHAHGLTTGAGAGDSHTSDAVHEKRDHSGLEKGALGAGAAAAGAGYLAHEHEKNKQPQNDIPAAAASSTTAPVTTSNTAPAPVQQQQQQRDVDSIPAPAAAAAAPAAASYQRNLPGSATAKPTTADDASTAAQVDPSEYPSKYDQGNGSSNWKRDGELAAGGLAAAGGAGYLAHRKHEEDQQDRPITSNTSSTPSHLPSAVDQQRYTQDPVPNKAVQSSPLNQSSTDAGSTGPTAPGEYHDYKKEEALAGGAGLAGLGTGAAYLASRDKKDNENEARRDDRPSTVAAGSGYPQRDSTTGGLNNSSSPATGGVYNTVVGTGSAEDPHARRFPLDNSNATTVGPQDGSGVGQQTADLGAPKSHNDREKQALAAAAGVGAGAGLVGAEEKHRHNKDNAAASPVSSSYSQPTSQQATSYTGAGSNPMPSSTAASQQNPAQTAAQQAWSKQDPTTGASGYGQPSPYKDDLKYGAAGAGALAGAGATAAYYGQGKEHDQNPRSAESEKIADRALGDGSTTGPSSGAVMPGSFPQDKDTVIHKCHACGVENDISSYF